MALLDHLGIERAEVVGHSLAADIVLQAVIDAPERFHTMTLLEPGMFTVPAAAGMDEAMSAVARVFESGDHRQAMLLFLGSDGQATAQHPHRAPIGFPPDGYLSRSAPKSHSDQANVVLSITEWT